MNTVFELDESYIQLIEERFNEKKKIAVNRKKQLFTVFNETLTEEEQMALKYVYAYMSLNDLGDYDGAFYLNHVRTMLKIRDKMPWGKSVPGQIFLHFVLPIRINNENLDYYCETFFNLLYDRVKDLSMAEAIQEINHWCHEKATYVGCDIRTISPLTLMKNGLGRCGEESSFATAALRSLGIPARQCYTPRWAHCDSNHAWVEAWADGTWYFFGACEPEVKLNMGWFTAPAARAMLVNTRVPGHYVRAEEVTYVDKWHTEINLLDNYTDTKPIKVKVVNEEGNAVEGAKVHLQVYNFAEFYPIAKLVTNQDGEVTLTTGFGDLFIHTFKDQLWGEGKLQANETYMEVMIAPQQPKITEVDMDMVPPPAKSTSSVSVTEEETKKNNDRLAYEDELRTNYQQQHFVQEDEARGFAKNIKLDEDRIWKVLKTARGNSHNIKEFLAEHSTAYGKKALQLLESLNDKDLMDTSKETLVDHLTYSVTLQEGYDDEIFIHYIMCPRVYYEMIEEYKQFFQDVFTLEQKRSFKDNPDSLIKWVRDNIEVTQNYTYYAGYASPKGSYELKKTNKFSRHILFVALARSFGIPARLEPTDRRPQYLKMNSWIDVDLDGISKHDDKLPTGSVTFVQDSDSDVKAEYYNNFSIARWEDTTYKTLDYSDSEANYFENDLELPVGYYRLTTGTRLGDGKVLTRINQFEVMEDTHYEIPLTFRKDAAKLQNLGDITELKDLTLLNADKSNNLDQNIDTVIAWIEPDREPSKHLIREIGELAESFNSFNMRLYICLGEDKITSAFDYKTYEGLPESVRFAVDNNYACLRHLMETARSQVSEDHPVVFVVDSKNIIRYASSGYKLGIGNEIVKVLTALDK